MRVLAVADTDSYLKWTAATLQRLPDAWRSELVLLRSELLPSADQQAAALGDHDRQVPALGITGLVALVRRLDPDVIILGATGPVVELLSALPVIAARRRVLVSGLPGISVPASLRAVRARRRCDVLVVHSRRERAEHARLIGDQRLDVAVALARLPYLDRDPSPSSSSDPDDVIFAAQALVPPQPDQRRQILEALSELPPPLRAVIKVRAVDGEEQTHREDHPYPQLWQELRADHHRPDSIWFTGGPMAQALRSARSLVTVSSTAALEAMALGIEVLVLRDFGLSAEMINEVFATSGCVGTLADLRAGRFRRPDPGWMSENYFHPPGEDDLVEVISARLRQRRDASAPPRSRSSWPRVARSALRRLRPPMSRRPFRRLRERLARR